MPASDPLRNAVVRGANAAALRARCKGREDCWLGDDELIEQCSAEQVIDARGGLVTPSFVDAHFHAAFGGTEMIRCDLTEAESAEESVRRVAEYAASHPEKPWILGGGWRMPHFASGTPRKEMLDEIAPDRPVFLFGAPRNDDRRIT